MTTCPRSASPRAVSWFSVLVVFWLTVNIVLNPFRNGSEPIYVNSFNPWLKAWFSLVWLKFLASLVLVGWQESYRGFSLGSSVKLAHVSLVELWFRYQTFLRLTCNCIRVDRPDFHLSLLQVRSLSLSLPFVAAMINRLSTHDNETAATHAYEMIGLIGPNFLTFSSIFN